jgi:hypothetical protein
MERSRLTQTIMKYQPAGKRNPGRPLKRLLDCGVETGTGHETCHWNCDDDDDYDYDDNDDDDDDEECQTKNSRSQSLNAKF